jgi:hypothetical protein
MRNSFPSQMYFVLPSIVCVTFVMHIPGSCSINCIKTKVSSFVNLSCHQQKQENHRSTLEQLTLGNYAATQLWEDWLRQLPGSWVFQSSASCAAIALPFPQFALLYSVPRVQLSLITIVRNCGCQFPWSSVALHLIHEIESWQFNHYIWCH